MSLYENWIKISPLRITDTFGDHHWDAFKTLRKKHNDNLCAETNKLVLIIDKLLDNRKNLRGKQSESTDLDKSIVEWTSDDLVKLCPYCAKSFNLTRRRHHCRTCGAVSCNNCSKYLEYRLACKLVKPAKLYTDPYDRIEDHLNAQAIESMPKIRLCEDCKRLLDSRLRVIEDHYCQPTFLEFYDKLRKSMNEADELILSQSSLKFDLPGQSKSASTASNKETELEIKTKIQDLRHRVALMSTKINKLAENENASQVSKTNNQAESKQDDCLKQKCLLKFISQSIVYWLEESVNSKATRMHGIRLMSDSPSGWVPEQIVHLNDMSIEDEDPILVQIKNLEEYIRQAKMAGRYEEVSALEANKRDLEIEYFMQQEENELFSPTQESPAS